MFPKFHGNRAIQLLGRAARWSISGRVGAIENAQSLDATQPRKAPIDIRHVLDGCNPGCQHPGPVRGAWATDEQCLVTLDELVRHIPNATNNAFYLKAITDGLLVIDIEPDCPPQVAANLLALPQAEILYKEMSMSGRGFHLLTPLPENFHDHPIAASRTVLRHEQGWYELLLKHWATFTRIPVPEDHPVLRMAPTDEHQRFTSVAELYEDLAGKIRGQSLATPGDVHTETEMPDIPDAEDIVQETLARAVPGMKSLDDFGGDNSRWEFSVLGRLYGTMQAQLRENSQFNDHVYTAGEQAWLLYAAVVQHVPARAKHHELRNNRPFLLDRAAALVAERVAQLKAQPDEQSDHDLAS